MSSQALPSTEATYVPQAQLEGKGIDDSGSKSAFDLPSLRGGDFAEELEGQVDALRADPTEAARRARLEVSLETAQGVSHSGWELTGDEEAEAAVSVSAGHQAIPRGGGRYRPG